MKLKGLINSEAAENLYKIVLAVSRVLPDQTILKFARDVIVITSPKNHNSQFRFSVNLPVEQFFHSEEYVVKGITETDPILLSVKASNLAETMLMVRRNNVDSVALSLISKNRKPWLQLVFYVNFRSHGLVDNGKKSIIRQIPVDIIRRDDWKDIEYNEDTWVVNSRVQLRESRVIACLVENLKTIDKVIMLDIKKDMDKPPYQDTSLEVRVVASGLTSNTVFPGTYVKVFNPDEFVLDPDQDEYLISITLNSKKLSQFLCAFGGLSGFILIGIRHGRYAVIQIRYREFYVNYILPNEGEVGE